MEGTIILKQNLTPLNTVCFAVCLPGLVGGGRERHYSPNPVQKFSSVVNAVILMVNTNIKYV